MRSSLLSAARVFRRGRHRRRRLNASVAVKDANAVRQFLIQELGVIFSVWKPTIGWSTRETMAVSGDKIIYRIPNRLGDNICQDGKTPESAEVARRAQRSVGTHVHTLSFVH